MAQSVCEDLVVIESELTGLDRAIGDGDHGLNIARGCEQLKLNLPKFVDLESADCLMQIGQTVLNQVGGAAGALYGSFLISVARHISDSPGLEALSASLEQGLATVEGLGKSGCGDKTLVDVLEPVVKLIKSGSTDPVAIADCATISALATVQMEARRGRAAYLGPRSIGHMDPGARSCSAIIVSICTYLRSH